MIKKINIERLLDQFPGMTYKFKLFPDGSYSFTTIWYSNFTDITEQKKNEKILEELNRSAVVLQKLNNEKEICQKTIEIADEILNFDASFLYLEKNNQFISFANSEARNEIMPLDYGLMGKAYKQNDNYLNPNLEKDSHARPTKSKYKSGITISMKNLGVFQAVSTEINGFKEKDLKLAEILIANTQAALERLKLQKEIKANNLLFQSTLESIQDGISVISPDFTILYTNSKMNQWHAKNMPLKGQKCYKAYNNLNEICPDCPSARSLKTGKVEKKIDQREKALGVEFTEIYSYPMIDEEGRVHGVVKFIRDISERKKKEMELKKTKNHLNKEINKARRIHERTLPNEIPDINNLKISAYYKPANRLGGDFYNLKKLDDNKLLFYIIDITGHGLDSAIMSSFVKSTINSYLNLSSPEKKLNPKNIIKFVYEQYKEENFPEDYFITMLVGIINTETQKLSYCSSGIHIKPVICNQKLRELPAGGLPISITIPEELLVNKTQNINLTNKDILFFSTDGLIEQSSGIKKYGGKFKEILLENCHLPPDAIKEEIKTNFKNFHQNNLEDDITFIIFKVNSEKTASKLKLKITSNIREVNQAKEKLEKFILSKNIDINIYKIKIVIHEMLINALEHGNKFDKDKEIEIKVIIKERYIQITVKDEGKGFNCNQSKKLNIDTVFDIQDKVAASGRGLGILITKNIADYLYYNHKGNEINFIKKL